MTVLQIPLAENIIVLGKTKSAGTQISVRLQTKPRHGVKILSTSTGTPPAKVDSHHRADTLPFIGEQLIGFFVHGVEKASVTTTPLVGGQSCSIWRPGAMSITRWIS